MGFSAAYRKFVAGHPEATVWHDADFLECLTAHENVHTWNAVELVMDDRLVGVLPICTKKRLDGLVITTPPLARYCSPLFDWSYLDDAGFEGAVSALLSKLPKGFVSLDQQWHPKLFDRVSFLDCVQYRELPTYKITLPNTIDEVSMLPRKKMRRTLRQASQYWTSCKGKLNEEALNLLRSPFTRQKLPVPFDNRSIISAYEYLVQKNQAVCHLAYDPDGTLQGATICLSDAHSAYCWIAGSSDAARANSCGSFLLSTEVRWAFEQGLEEVDFLGSALPGPAENRRQLGGVKQAYPHVFIDTNLATKAYRKWRMR